MRKLKSIYSANAKFNQNIISSFSEDSNLGMGYNLHFWVSLEILVRQNLIEPLERDRPVTAPTSSVTTGEKTDPNQGSRALFVIPG